MTKEKRRGGRMRIPIDFWKSVRWPVFLKTLWQRMQVRCSLLSCHLHGLVGLYPIEHESFEGYHLIAYEN